MINKRAIIILIGSVLFLSSGLPVLSQPQLEEEVSLKGLIEEALSNNPQLRSAKKRYEAERLKVVQATALEDPQFGIEWEEIPKGGVDFEAAPMRMYSISQGIPFPTKILTRTIVQKEGAGALYQRYKETERDIISKVKSAYSQLFLAYRAIAITKENKALLEQLATTAATRFSLGKASQQDALKAQVEIARMDNELIMLEQKRQVVIAKLNVLLDRPTEQGLGIPKIEEDITDIGPIDQYYKVAKEKRPELLAVRKDVGRQKGLYSLAMQEFLPDFMFQVQQREVNSHFDGWDAMVKINVPLWFIQKETFEVAQAKRELRMVEAEYKNMENMVLLEVKETHSMAEALMKLATLYKTSFIPQAEQTLKASSIGYEAGETDFLNLLDSQRMLLDFKLDYYETLVNLEIAKADLEKAVGVDLNL